MVVGCYHYITIHCHYCEWFDLKMAAKERLFLFVFLLYPHLVLCEVSINVYCDYNCTKTKSVTMFGLFSAPYANLDSAPSFGYLYNPQYENTSNSSSCDSVFPPPPPPVFNTSNGSILLLSNYSHCMLERLLLARAVGYDVILSYTEDDTNTTITESIVNTGIPIALIQYKHLQTILGWVVWGNNTNTSIAVAGSILSGAIIVTTAFVSFVSCFCCLCTICCLCCKIYLDSRDSGLEPLLREDGSRYRSRQELIESILHHLQQMENELGAQVPLGRDGIEKFPKREYAGNGEERDTTCCICVDDFKPGQEVRELPCQHLFHPSCIDEWLSEHSSVCPLCKMDLRGRAGDNNGSSSSSNNNNNRRNVRTGQQRRQLQQQSLTDYGSSDSNSYMDSRRVQSTVEIA